MTTIFELPIDQIQPSQLYISQAKLAGVHAWLEPDGLSHFTPIPVKELNGRIIYTDGHTRAFALYQKGVQTVPVYRDEDELDWEAYQICVDWCLEAGIRRIADLAGRILDEEAYKTLWLKRCAAMQQKREE